MDTRSSGLLRELVKALSYSQPQYFHLTPDGLWLADFQPKEDGATALVLQRFDPDGNARLRCELLSIEAQRPTPYCWLTDEAVVLLHAPEDPLEPDEDKTVTLRWFPYETLTENVWAIDPAQLPGSLSGVVQFWSDGGCHTLQGLFLQGDDVCNAYVRLDPESRSCTLLWSGAPGVHKGEPALPRPTDGPDPGRLVMKKELIELATLVFSLPDGHTAIPMSLAADRTRCRLELHVVHNGEFEKVEVSGKHYDFFFPFRLGDGLWIVDLKQLTLFSRLCLEGPFERQIDLCPQIRLYRDVIEVERQFAQAHLTLPCRNAALYADENCYRWQLDYGGSTVIFELPYLLWKNELDVISQLARNCMPYLKAEGLLQSSARLDRLDKNYAASKALFHKLFGGVPPVYFDFDRGVLIDETPEQREQARREAFAKTMAALERAAENHQK